MDNTKKEFDYWMNWSSAEWSDWLKAELQKRRQVFLSDPDELTSSYTRERSHARDYHGRELLELIQNADDAGIDYSQQNKLLIKLTDSGLFVANTGIPFSPAGIKSLIVSDNSPKQFLRTKCIGYKGLGFRSILGWASSIAILSGKLSIGFKETFASAWLESLRKESSDLNEKVKMFEESGNANPIATLSIPRLLTPEDFNGGDEFSVLYKEGQDILSRGYDSVVCLHFKEAEKTKEQIQNQIASLGSKILLFLQYLEIIEIESSGRNEVWSVERKENEICVNPQSESKKCWRIFKREGNIPKEHLRTEQLSNNKFEIKLAVSRELVEVNRLFVFFPTEVLFPFPIIAHATFEVGENRQHLIDSEANRFIAGELADLMAASAECIKDAEVPWLALSTISPRGEIDLTLQKFGFNELLKEKTKQYDLLPVRDKKFYPVANAKIIRGNFDDVFTGDAFSDLCIFTNDNFIKQQLNILDVEFIGWEELSTRLNRIADGLSIDMRGEIIYRLINCNLIEATPPELLIDENGEKINVDSPVFLPPEGKTFSLPGWITQKILNTQLVLALRDKFQVTRIRDLMLNLRPFGVQEYSLNSLVSSIVAETNRRCKDTPDQELEFRQQMLKALWSLYSSDEGKVELQEQRTVILPTRNDEFKPAKDIYFGKEYSSGKILEYFYNNVDLNFFVANPEKLGMENVTLPELEKFLAWLGVNSKPRYVEKSFKWPDKFIEYIISSIKYPAVFTRDMAIGNADELKKNYYSKSAEGCLDVDRLDEILAKADPHAVLCWIATNPDIELWRVAGDVKASFHVARGSQTIWRTLLEQKIPSYPFWLLKTTKWLPSIEGNLVEPRRCCLGRGTRDFSTVIGYPAVNKEHPLVKEFNLDDAAIKRALLNIGVVDDLDELPWDSFYQVLLELPNLDADGEKAKRLYRTLISRSDSDIPEGEKYQEFFKRGKMFGRMGSDANYFPIDKLFYLENITIPRNIAEQYPLLELDRRRGAAKVKKLFGVEQLTKDVIQAKITNFERHPAFEAFKAEIDRLKPYIYALRVDGDLNRADLRALKEFNINLCRYVEVSISIDNENKLIELKDGDAINVGADAYLVAEPSNYADLFLEDEMIADAVGEIISNIFKVDIKSEIARLASCSINKREQLLNRIVGSSGEERLTKVKEVFQMPFEKEEFGQLPLDYPLRPSDSMVNSSVDEPTKPSKEEPKGDEVGPVVISDKEMPPIESKRVIIRKIQLNPKTSTTPHSKKRVNPDRAENIAVRVEEFQGRYPLKISHIRGLESYGCDIISFNSEEELNVFKEKNDANLIVRFIEVKGSSAEKGAIILKGNELKGAQTYKERFYLYRIYEDENGFELIELNDPIASEKDAFDIQYEINPFRSEKSLLWEVKEKE